MHPPHPHTGIRPQSSTTTNKQTSFLPIAAFDFKRSMEEAPITYASLADDVVKAVQEKCEGPSAQLWVAITGGPASGKTTLTQELCKRLEKDKGLPTAVIPMDGYHYYKRELDAMPDSEALHARRGAHWTFNAEKFVRDIKRARQEGSGKFPSFDHHHGDPVEDAIEVCKTHRVVLVEGNYLSLSSIPPWDKIGTDSGIFDERWYVACPLDVARDRVIARHISTGNTKEQATKRADENDVVNGKLVDEETRKNGWATRVIVL